MKAPSPLRRSSVMRIGMWLVLAPLLAVVGAFVVATYLPQTVRWLWRLPSYWADSLPCPSGHPNPVASRWECGDCHGQYMGWVGKCSVCGSTDVEWFPCEVCELAVVLPWRRFD